MKAKSILVKTVRELDDRLDSLDKSFIPTLAIAFGDPSVDLNKMAHCIEKRSIQLVGCSSAGEINNDKITDHSFSVLLLDLDKRAFRTIHQPGEGQDYTSVGQSLGRKATEAFADPAILLYIGGMGVDGHSVICGLREEVDETVPLFGGMAGDDFQFQKLQIFGPGGVHDSGVTALIVDRSHVDIEGHSYSGWNELGMQHTITKCSGNILYEVDQKPALDLFNRYFRDLDYAKVADSDDLFTLAGVFALSIKRKDGTAFMRSTLMFDFENKALVLAGGVEEGDSFRFCPTPSFDVVDNTIDIFKALHHGKSKPEAVIMNSCAARLVAFGPLLEDEVKGIRGILEQAPMVGYMAYGEIGRRDEEEEYGFHNVTCSIVNISERT